MLHRRTLIVAAGATTLIRPIRASELEKATLRMDVSIWLP